MPKIELLGFDLQHGWGTATGSAAHFEERWFWNVGDLAIPQAGEPGYILPRRVFKNGECFVTYDKDVGNILGRLLDCCMTLLLCCLYIKPSLSTTADGNIRLGRRHLGYRRCTIAGVLR